MRKGFFVVFALWIDYIGLTVIEQRDIILADLSNICGYLSFFPLSGVP